MSMQDYILGVALLGHDLSLTVIDECGQVIFVAEEERYSRIKGGRFVFHPDLIIEILAKNGITPHVISALAIAGTPSCWTEVDERILSFSSGARTRHLDAWSTDLCARFPNLRTLRYLRHHRAHAASAFFSSPWEQAVVVTVDGFGDGEVATISRGCGASLELLESQPFPHSLPYLFSAIATWLGMEGHEKEGKLMTLASYGHPEEVELLRSLLSNCSDGPWRVAPTFLHVECKNEVWARALNHLIGPGRNPKEPITTKHYNIAASIQVLLEEELLNLLHRASRLTGALNCCCAGGAFLNCAANGLLQHSRIFQEIFFHPLASDTGLSLGAALYLAREQKLPAWHIRHLRLGSTLDEENIPEISRQYGVCIRRPPDIVDLAARRIAAGAVVGWCQGRMEVGPRALGGRSLLADPRRYEMIDRINQIKQREPWQPVAPIVLEEDVANFFGKSIRSPYMNVAFSVLKPEAIPAAVHIDGTSRLQTIADENDPLTCRLLRRFRKLTGVGVLLNTSLNVRGQPIARTVADCVAFFCTSKVDLLIIGDFLIERAKHDECKSVARMQPNRGRLPSNFILVTLDIDDTINPLVIDLQGKATGVIQLPINSSFNIISYDDIFACDFANNFVFFLPGYIETCNETLPRVLAWLIRIHSHFPRIWIADLSGKTIEVNLLIQGLDVEALEALPLSDVEIHYLRRLSRNGNSLYPYS